MRRRAFSGQRSRNIGLLGKENEPKTKECIEIHGTAAEMIAHRDKKNKSSAKYLDRLWFTVTSPAVSCPDLGLTRVWVCKFGQPRPFLQLSPVSSVCLRTAGVWSKVGCYQSGLRSLVRAL